MKEPVATITNLAYLIAGVLIWNAWLTPALILLAITSAGYHWTKEYEWRMADVDSMLLVMSLSLFYVWGIPMVFALFLTAVLMITEVNRTLAVVVWFALVCTGVYLTGGVFWFVIPFVIGGLCNIPFLWLSWNKRLTDWIHGGWHIATATGLYMLI